MSAETHSGCHSRSSCATLMWAQQQVQLLMLVLDCKRECGAVSGASVHSSVLPPEACGEPDTVCQLCGFAHWASEWASG
eukprot:2753979-Amphidinium_carterae.1